MRRSRNFVLLIILAAFYLVSCDSSGDNSTIPPAPPDPGIENQYSPVNAFNNLIFDRPLGIENAGDGTNRLFVVEHRGVILVINNVSATQSGETVQLKGIDATSNVFLDIQDQVFFDENEQGLLGLTFHPDYENNGFFYLNYMADNPLRNVISQFAVSEDNPNIADADSEVILLEIEQPHPFHNGGQLVFGPNDGFLYISVGDGGHDFEDNAQDLSNLFGAVLRVDVDNPDGGMNYGIPSDNPFFGNTSGFREEIYAYGLRNPWRMSFDSVTGALWTGDVGDQSLEEIDIVEKGKNYGWPIMEGTNCYDPPSGCDMSGLELPIWEYGRNKGRTIIGGFVYRGAELPELFGKYIYADFVSGRVWALSFDGLTVTDNTQLLRFADMDSFIITSFGIDEQNELYITGFDGNIYRLVRTENLQENAFSY
ncbi:MAG: PQQ-dependent sugar dehydrogenase [Candidatus Dadabacteria bacterium]|nr:PQQ-dependent sugar dehydrogenase [Candidatus Dadabacteria bacterium]